ncbi:VOC family protein [Pseudomonas sp. Pc102]|uniref:VOC family protein n=1 Tax=Pseudomonas sp. Pc102 TaxID=2678261 RepID=UPI001BCC7B07|nr:VOC family protein [Pseudomonas sp. Pc102]BBP83551.1 VOC family protein [Pseudomonas sp. Pc102]
MPIHPRITPCLWFDDQAEAAVDFYIGIFPNSRITAISRYGEAGRAIHGRPPGSIMTLAFELDGQLFTALNGGPAFRFNEAISLQVDCHDQDEVDHYWNALGAGGPVEAQQCGWLKDRFGLSWQIVPRAMIAMMQAQDGEKSQRAFQAMLGMKKLDIAALQRAFDGD